MLHARTGRRPLGCHRRRTGRAARSGPTAGSPAHRGARGRRAGRTGGRCHRMRLGTGYVARRGPATGRNHRCPGSAPAHGTRTARSSAAPAPLQTVQPRLHRPLVVVRRRQQHPGADQLQLQPRRSRPAHLRQTRVDQIGGPAQLRRAEDGSLRGHPLHDVGRGVDQPLLPRVRHGRQDHQIPQPLQEVGDEAPGIVAALDDAVHDLEGRRAVARGERLHDRVQQRAVRVAQERRRHGVRHTVRRPPRRGAGP